MADIKLEIRIGKRGETGVSLEQLGSVSEETQKFLRMLGDDLQIETNAENWRVIGVSKGSLKLKVAYTQPVRAAAARSYRSAIRRVSKYRPASQNPPKKMRRDTLLQYARIGRSIAHDQKISFGVPREKGERALEWGELTRVRSDAIFEALQESVQYHGFVQGTIHSLNKGSEPPFFQMRDLATRYLVKCIFKPSDYSKIVSLLRKRHAIIIASGFISASRQHRTIESIEISKVEEAGEISDSDFDSLFGSAPGFTGDLTTEEFVDRIRRDG